MNCSCMIVFICSLTNIHTSIYILNICVILLLHVFLYIYIYIYINVLASLSKKYFSGFEVAVQPQATFYVLANFSPLRCAKTMPTDVELIKFFRDMCDQVSYYYLKLTTNPNY